MAIQNISFEDIIKNASKIKKGNVFIKKINKKQFIKIPILEQFQECIKRGS